MFNIIVDTLTFLGPCSAKFKKRDTKFFSLQKREKRENLVCSNQEDVQYPIGIGIKDKDASGIFFFLGGSTGAKNFIEHIKICSYLFL